MSLEHLETNQLLRSAYQIAERNGVDTNWAAFKQSLKKVLIEQSKSMNRTSDLTAATCTARTYRTPR